MPEKITCLCGFFAVSDDGDLDEDEEYRRC